MFPNLKNHPFAVEAFFESSLVLTFAVHIDEIQTLIPPCLELETFNNKWAFIAVAMVQTKDLRPRGFPRLFGNDFFLIGYRVFVRYVNRAGKRLRGLYILKSETDNSKMQFLGNMFTHYNYMAIDINQKKQNNTLEISSANSAFKVTVDTMGNENIPLPYGSPFPDWKEARRFAGPLPFTFTYLRETEQVLIIEGVREHWTPKPVQVLGYSFDYLNKMNLKFLILANAFVIENIPYAWKKGKLESWKAK